MPRPMPYTKRLSSEMMGSPSFDFIRALQEWQQGELYPKGKRPSPMDQQWGLNKNDQDLMMQLISRLFDQQFIKPTMETPAAQGPMRPKVKDVLYDEKYN